MRSERPWRSLALLIAVVLVGAQACGQSPDAEDPPPVDDTTDETDTPDDPNGTDDQPDDADDDAAPTETDDADDAAEDAEDLPFVEVYFVRADDSGFWVEPERHQLDAPTLAVARAAMELLFSAEPHDPELTSLVPDGVEVLDVSLDDGLLTVDVSGELAEQGGASAQEVAFTNQFAHTATAFDTVDAVVLWIDGEPIDGLWGHVDFSQPIEPDPFALSPITITSPPMGPDGASAEVGEVVLGGEATVFEATFLIRVLAPDGAVVEDTFVTATAGGPERGTWEHTVTLSDPGTYTVEVAEDDPSDGEGRPPFVSTRIIEVG
ncbi:MAG: hypothetical protein EA388_08580 [Nitriliruptor sp.]|nr:MAG: hypothetical protein EA388_08580 [Nitriliruptor sp.]